ncbi:MAG: OadG family protein [Treponema sp.]|jgi:sodium pump decarboxylase gamma subunit|nr:OadG family protein [Treponema sp.]
MTILDMLQQSVILTIFGMTVVFAFLWFMIICVNGVGKIVHKLGWDADVQSQPHKEIKKNGNAGNYRGNIGGSYGISEKGSGFMNKGYVIYMSVILFLTFVVFLVYKRVF